MRTNSYRSLRQRHKTVKFQVEGDLKKGVWVPVAIAELLSPYSSQSIRLLGFKGSIETAKFKVGPLLINLDSLKKLKNRQISKI